MDKDKVFDDWNSLCEMPSLKIDEARFYPEFLLPHPKEHIFHVLADSYHEFKDDRAPEDIIDSIAIHVGRLNKFQSTLSQPYETFQCKFLGLDSKSEAYSDQLSELMGNKGKYQQIDVGLSKLLADGLIKFCQITGYDRDRMIRLNAHLLVALT